MSCSSPSESYGPEQIIGTPIKIGNLEVAQNDFPKGMAWIEAKNACANLGSGWRLPTKNELNLMYLNKDKIGGFAINFYWSSTESGSSNAWWQNFFSGSQNVSNKDGYNRNVRAVRAF